MRVPFYRHIARIFREGVRVGSEDAKLQGGLGACSPGKILETLDCLRLHFAHFHGGEREKENVEQLKEKVNRQRLIVC